MIAIKPSPNADSRTLQGPVGVAELRKSTESHIHDVTLGLSMIAEMINARGPLHDHTKIEMMDEFHAALTSGHIKDTQWYNHHTTAERHHLKVHVPEDVNLIDVLEHVVDCSMAGLARSGEIYDIDLDPDVLRVAVQNTVKLIKKNTRVINPDDETMNNEKED